MAKHLASEASWAAANVALDTHGGNGFASSRPSSPPRCSGCPGPTDREPVALCQVGAGRVHGSLRLGDCQPRGATGDGHWGNVPAGALKASERRPVDVVRPSPTAPSIPGPTEDAIVLGRRRPVAERPHCPLDRQSLHRARSEDVMCRSRQEKTTSYGRRNTGRSAGHVGAAVVTPESDRYAVFHLVGYDQVAWVVARLLHPHCRDATVTAPPPCWAWSRRPSAAVQALDDRSIPTFTIAG